MELMQLDRDQINQKLAQLEEYVSQIKKYGQKPESEFTADSMVEAAAERVIYIEFAKQIPSYLKNLAL